MPSYAQLFRVRAFVAIFVANALSAWGDHLARLTVAAFVLARSGSPLAAATTLAVSLVPSLFGRSLLGPIADRFPYRYVLIAANVVRAAFVALIIVAVAGGWSLDGCCRCCSSSSSPAGRPSRRCGSCSRTCSRTAGSTPGRWA